MNRKGCFRSLDVVRFRIISRARVYVSLKYAVPMIVNVTYFHKRNAENVQQTVQQCRDAPRRIATGDILFLRSRVAHDPGASYEVWDPRVSIFTSSQANFTLNFGILGFTQ